MTVRRAQSEQDKLEIKEMWRDIFAEKEPFLSWFFSHHYCSENTFVAEKNGRIVSAAQYIEYPVFDPLPRRGAYICGVCTLKEYRKGGLASDLLAYMEDVMSARGIEVFFLYPLTRHIYQRRGFQFVSSLYSAEFQVSDIRQREGKRFSPNADIALLDRLYCGRMKKFDCFVRRDPKAWEDIFSDMKNRGGQVFASETGYFFVLREGKTLNVPEAVVKNRRELDELLSLVASMGESGDKISLKMPRRLWGFKKEPGYMAKGVRGKKCYFNLTGWL